MVMTVKGYGGLQTPQSLEATNQLLTFDFANGFTCLVSPANLLYARGYALSLRHEDVIWQKTGAPWWHWPEHSLGAREVYTDIELISRLVLVAGLARPEVKGTYPDRWFL